jgi:DNA-binding CsgD family transcriptional regulator
MHMTRRTAAFVKRGVALVRSPFGASVVLFAAIVALRFSTHASEHAGVLLLLIGPIAVMSIAYGPRVGTVAATAGCAAYVLSQIENGGLDAINVGTRAFTFYLIPVTIWLARHDAQRRAATESRPEPVDAPSAPPARRLTPREREVLALVAAGHTNAEIAAMLVLSVRTVESHRASLRRKLGRPSRPELVRQAQRWGLLPADAATNPRDGVPVTGGGVHGLVY